MTTWSDIVASSLGAVATLGGVGAIAAAVAKLVSDHTSQRWLQDNQGKLDHALETHRSELAREAELHKLTLKRQELIYQRELEAGDAFMKVWRTVYPQYRFPDMDWHDACEDVASLLGSVENVLEEYLEKHTVAISQQGRELLERARSEAASEKFFQDGPDASPPKNAVDAAGQVLDALRKARDQLLDDLRR